MNVLEAANWCANDKKMESNNKQEVKDMEKDKSNTDIIPQTNLNVPFFQL